MENTKKQFNLGDQVSHPDIYSGQSFEVVGIRKNQIELYGDWSGGTHNTYGSCWLDLDNKFYIATS